MRGAIRRKAGSVANIPDVEKIELYLVYRRMQVVVKEELAQFGVDPSTLNVDAAINPTAIRNALIRAEFNDGRALGIKAERLYSDLSLKHGLSFDRVADIVKRKL